MQIWTYYFIIYYFTFTLGEPGHQNDHFEFIKFLNHIYEKSNEVLKDERDEIEVKLKYFLRLKRREYKILTNKLSSP